MMAELIKCIFVNVNSIVSRHRRHYLNLFLQEHSPDVLLIAEHKLSPRHKLDLVGYKTFRQDRIGGRGGGTAILTRDSLCSNRLMLDLGNIENTAVRIDRTDGSVMTVVSMYLRPQQTLSLSDLDPIMDLSTRGGLLIGGDLNARHVYWGDNFCNPSGRCLREFLLSCPDIAIHPTEGPTYFCGTSSSYLDIFMSSSDISLATSSANGLRTLQYQSDHHAVEIMIQGRDLQRAVRPAFFDFDRMDRKRFNRILARNLPDSELPVDRNVTSQEIDASIESMSAIFRNAMEESIPKIPSGNRGLMKLPSNILHLISEKKRLRRILYRTPDPTRYSILRADVRNLDRIIQGAIATYENSYWTDYLRRIRLNNRTFSQVRRGAGICKRAPIGNLVDSNGTFLATDFDKAELLADRFSDVHKSGCDMRASSFGDIVRREVSTLSNHEPFLTFGRDMLANGTMIDVNFRSVECNFVTPGDVGYALRRRANKKSSGRDKIPDFVLRKTEIGTWRHLAILVNHCLNIGYFPVEWKRALVVPIPKYGSNSRTAGDYRPISLLSSFGKLLEWFIVSGINRRIVIGGVLRDCQFGFKNGHSTSHALVVFADYVARGLNKRYPTLAVSLDFAKAFDTVWQDGIIYKMMDLGFDKNTCRIVTNFLRDRTFCVGVNGELSNGRTVEAGVPQGSILGPVLYNIFVSDIPQPPEGDILLIYADDMLVAMNGARARTLNNRMNTYLDILNDYFRKWGLKLNLGKTDGIMIKGRRGRLYPNSRGFIPSLSIGGEAVRTSDRIKYLGVIFHEDFEYYRHIDYVLEKVRKVFYSYIGILRRRNALTNEVRLLVYRQIIRPLMAYAFPVWFGISSHQMERLRIWERRILSSCLGLGPRMCSDGIFRRPTCKSIYNGIDFERIDVFLVGSAIKFLERASSLDNGIVTECFQRPYDLGALHLNRYFSPIDILTLKNGNLLYGDAGLLFYHRKVNTLNIEDLVYNTEQ